MSTTPRTDAALYPMTGGVDIVWPDFARSLETELATAKAECERLAEHLKTELHDLSLDLSTANHMIKLERDRANALQTRLNEIDGALRKLNLID